MPVWQGGASALPYYASLDDANQFVDQPPNPAGGQNYVRKVSGEYIEIPVNIFFRVACDATVTTRSPFVQILDGDGHLVDRIFSTLNQAASQTIDHRFSIGLGAPYSPDPTVANTPLFTYVLPSGYRLQCGGANLQPGDQVSLVSIVLQQIPTGGSYKPAPGSEAVAAVRPPLLV